MDFELFLVEEALNFQCSNVSNKQIIMLFECIVFFLHPKLVKSQVIAVWKIVILGYVEPRFPFFDNEVVWLHAREICKLSSFLRL